MHLKKRILVTGGAGFIGSHLCEHLLQKDYEVICLDNFYTGTKQNILHLFENPARLKIDGSGHDLEIAQIVNRAGAEQALREALAQDPDHYAARRNLAWVTNGVR